MTLKTRVSKLIYTNNLRTDEDLRERTVLIVVLSHINGEYLNLL